MVLSTPRILFPVSCAKRVPPPTGERASGSLADKEDATTDIYLHEETEQSGTMDADLTLLSEQRAMQVVHRFQKLSMLALEQPDEQLDEQPDAAACCASNQPVCHATRSGHLRA